MDWPRSMNSWGSYAGDCLCRECTAVEPDLCNECDGSGTLTDGKACPVCADDFQNATEST
jgi:hypothetical protein